MARARRAAQRLVRDEAEDVAQQAAFEVWCRRGGCSTRDLAALVARIARQRASNVLRRRRLEREFLAGCRSACVMREGGAAGRLAGLPASRRAELSLWILEYRADLLAAGLDIETLEFGLDGVR